jgi:hypothetical protein
MKTVSDPMNPTPVPLRNFTYRNEQARENDLKRVIKYRVFRDVTVYRPTHITDVSGKPKPSVFRVM